MKERPMLFSGPMVRALLEGRKTVTRRLITPQSAHFGSASRLFWNHADLSLAWVDGKGSTEEYLHVPCHRGDAAELDRLDDVWKDRGPHGYRDQYSNCGPCEVCDHQGWRMTCHRLWSRIKPGDRIWVRETFSPVRFPGKPFVGVHYAAGPDAASWVHAVEAGRGYVFQEGAGEPDARWPEGFRYPWRPSIHMPRWASRLSLEVLSVRAERLQDITENEAIREAVVVTAGLCRTAFAEVWDVINGKRAPWESNPLVWRYELRRC